MTWGEIVGRWVGRLGNAMLIALYAGVGVAAGFGYETFSEEPGRFWFAVAIPAVGAFAQSLIPRPTPSP